MPDLLDEIKSLFGKSDLYDVLNISETSSSAQIKKAYYKISLTVHPDKCDVEEREVATKKFQVLGKVYNILSDKNLRSVYDETGSVDEDGSILDGDTDWYEYWRRCFPKISLEDIKNFEAKYRNSEEEKKDLIKQYKKHKGDMDRMMDEMMCSTIEDEPRFREILKELIEEGKLKDYDTFSNEAPKRKKARMTRYTSEKEEAEKILEDLKRKNNIPDGVDSLSALILKNKEKRQKMSSLLDEMAEKYSKKPQPSKRGKAKTSKKK